MYSVHGNTRPRSHQVHSVYGNEVKELFVTCHADELKLDVIEHLTTLSTTKY